MEEDDDEVVPLPNVNSSILKKVITWCNYHKDDPPIPDEDDNREKRTDDISSWDADFLKVILKIELDGCNFVLLSAYVTQEYKFLIA